MPVNIPALDCAGLLKTATRLHIANPAEPVEEIFSGLLAGRVLSLGKSGRLLRKATSPA